VTSPPKPQVDIWNNADACHYAWTTLAGDGQVSTCVTSQADSDPWAKTGVMIRASSVADSAYVTVVVTPGEEVSMQYRTVEGANSQLIAGSGYGFLPAWVEITRVAGEFTGYQSSDGITWQIIGCVSIGMPSMALAGLDVTRHDAGVISTATFDTVILIQAPAATSWNRREEQDETRIRLCHSGDSYSASRPGIAVFQPIGALDVSVFQTQRGRSDDAAGHIPWACTLQWRLWRGDDHVPEITLMRWHFPAWPYWHAPCSRPKLGLNHEHPRHPSCPPASLWRRRFLLRWCCLWRRWLRTHHPHRPDHLLCRWIPLGVLAGGPCDASSPASTPLRQRGEATSGKQDNKASLA
jgi:hypothetical protein